LLRRPTLKKNDNVKLPLQLLLLSPPPPQPPL
jgi:hypothetical protein